MSKDEAIEILSDMRSEYNLFGDEEEATRYHVLSLAIKAINDEPERKTGKWKLNKDGNWACPFCEFDPYHDNMKGMNFCPNCGARMVSE